MSVARKGAIIQYAGIIMIMVTIIWLFVITQAIETKQRSIMLKGELSMSGQNQVELARKLAQANVDSVIEKSLEKTTKNCLNQEGMRLDLVSNIVRGMPVGTIDISKSEELDWRLVNITLDSIDRNWINMTGSQVLIFRNSKIDMKINVTLDYSRDIESTFFDC